MMPQDVPALEQPQQTQENQFRFIINVLMRRWRMIGAFTAVTMLLTGFLGMYKKEEARATFRARAEVLVKQSAWEKEILQGVGGASLAPSRRSLVAEAME
jgi:capsular polysaccharide biosynthesis protein